MRAKDIDSDAKGTEETETRVNLRDEEMRGEVRGDMKIEDIKTKMWNL